jgi:diguanylate cyclase (GGDEF)-like protein
VLSVALALLVGPDAARALDLERPIWRNVQDVWDVDDGLPQSSVNALAQTPDGYLWVGTYDGLARFDGFRFEVFRPSGWPGLGSGAIRALYVDGAGKLWIGTGGGGLSVREATGVIRAIPGTAGWLVRAIVGGGGSDVDAGELWVGTSGHGLRRLTPRGPPEAVPIAPEVASVNALHLDADGTLWIGTDGNGLWRRDGDGAMTRVDTGAATLIVSLYRDRQGDLWVGSAGAGLLRLHGGGGPEAVPEAELGSQTVSALAEDAAGGLWIATGGGGLVRRSGGHMERHSRTSGLPHDVLSAVLEDREGALWVGLAAAGLVRLQGGSFSSLGVSDGLAGDVVYSAAEDATGELWVATVSGTLSRGRGDRFVVEPIPGLPTRTPLRAVIHGTNGDLWVGTYGRGVARRTAARWQHFTEADGLPNDHVRALLADPAGTVWAATIRGLGRYTDGVWTSPIAAEALPASSLLSLATDAAGNLWFGMDGGGLGCLATNGQLRLFSRGDGLASDVVLALRVGADGRTLWIGTNGGLSRLVGDQITTWTTAQGLPSDNIAQLAEDGHGFLWVGTAAGVARIRLDSLVPGAGKLDLRVFARGGGLASSQSTAPSNGPLVTRDGRLWFPTLAGLAVVDPEHLTHDDAAPVIHVEQVLADGQALPLGLTVRLPRGTARLEVQYTGICTRAGQLVRFRHRLVGFEQDWVDVGSRRSATYTAVPPGAYRFEVTATNADGVSAAADLGVLIPRRFWELPAFRWAAPLFVTLLLVAAGRVRIEAVERRQRELEATVTTRTEEVREANLALADRNRQLAELSFRDALTGLANRRRFDEDYTEEWRRAVRAGSWLSLAVIDIDCFKQYNDRLGHAAGDDCIKRVADAVAAAANRAGELTARWGGEELAVLLPGSTPNDCCQLLEILRRAVAELAIPHPASQAGPVVTISVGGASLQPTRDHDPLCLFEAADNALYRAKHGGRNRADAAVL